LHLEESGSNQVEKLWSGTGGFGAISSGQRDYDAEEGRRRIEDSATLKKYEAEGLVEYSLRLNLENRHLKIEIKSSSPFAFAR
jgi:hypothetical protein